MVITAKTVSELRERTGAALMDCKRALEATGGDMEAAVDHLRKTGLKSAEKRAGRSTAEGRVAVLVARDGRSGAIVALTSETDFVARTDDFKSLLGELVALAHTSQVRTPDELLARPLRGGTAGDAVKQLSGKLGENVQVPQVAAFTNARGFVGGYVHHNDRTGALASVTCDAPAEKASAFLKELGMHIAFARPQALTREAIAPEVVARERAVHAESEEVLSKPAERRDKIVAGKLEKFFTTVALLEQPWYRDDKLDVRKALAAALGPGARIEGFALVQVGS
jgi:elongation factor Ts